MIHRDMTRAAHHVLGLVGLALLVLWLIAHAAGCIDARPAVAEATYLGQQLRCVDKYNTRDAIEACRARVRRDWGIAETVTKDAGGDR